VARSPQSTPKSEIGSPIASANEASVAATLRATTARYRALVQSITDAAIVVVDASGGVVSWTAVAEQLLGYREDEILGQHVRVFFPPEDQAQGVPEQELQRARVGARVDSQGWRVRQNGTRFWAEVRVTPILSDGDVNGFVIVVGDRPPPSPVSSHRQWRRRGRTRLRSATRSSAWSPMSCARR